ncbi:MAG TPA: protein kinase [Aggregatilineales bacterium]|nr:protein kinase [Anaerolineales bacterium]HRE46646.1 protein kinase [Aggregatilineales bacterium]
MNELIGRKLGQYEITALLGEGGMATVYRAHQTSVRRDVAVKIIESKLACNPEFIRRFERETMTIAALDHSHILKIHDFGREDNLLHLGMELKSGGSLIRAEQLSAEQTAHYLDQIASALLITPMPRGSSATT